MLSPMFATFFAPRVEEKFGCVFVREPVLPDEVVVLIIVALALIYICEKVLKVGG